MEILLLFELLVGGINYNHVLRDVSATNTQFSLRFLVNCAVTGEALRLLDQMAFRSMMSLSSGFKLLAGRIVRSDGVSVRSTITFQIQIWSGTSEIIHCNVNVY